MTTKPDDEVAALKRRVEALELRLVEFEQRLAANDKRIDGVRINSVRLISRNSFM